MDLCRTIVDIISVVVTKGIYDDDHLLVAAYDSTSDGLTLVQQRSPVVKVLESHSHTPLY